MHIHYLTLEHLAGWLNQRLVGYTLVEAFSQQKDELVLGFGGEGEDLYLRLACTAPLPHIWPAEQYRKAKKNVVELFHPLYGKDVTEVQVVPWERVLILKFEDNFEAVLKMHGSQSNVLLRQNGMIEEIFRQQKAEDLQFTEEGGEWNQDVFPHLQTPDKDNLVQTLRQISPTLDRNFANRILQDGLQPDFKAQVEGLLAECRNDQFFIHRKGDKIQFLLFDPQSQGAFMKEGIFEALNFFFRNYFLLQHYSRLYQETQRLIGKPLKKAQGQEASYWRNLDNLETKRSDEEIGHILMANLHNLTSGLKKAELLDFYHDKPIVIKLKPELNPQQNAEVYYQKHKKRKTKNKHLEALIEELQQVVAKYEALGEEFAAFPEPKAYALTENGLDYQQVKGLQKFRKKHEKVLQSGQKKQQAAQQRFMEFEKDGYRIYVGRNSKNNDELSLHFAKKDDLWLHAKDVAGSHVIVRNPGGKPVPTPVLEYAASLAAYFSKRKNEELVPVSYTPKKYIRKTRHLAPGEVIVEREDVLLIEPKPFN